MQAPKIKFTQRLNPPIIRKRDGMEATHCIRINLTTDEALLISGAIGELREHAELSPTHTLVRVALGMIAEKEVSEDDLLKDMAKWRLREALAVALYTPDFNRALTYLESLQKPKPETPSKTKADPLPNPAKESPPVAAPKVRREYVFTPDPRRK